MRIGEQRKRKERPGPGIYKDLIVEKRSSAEEVLCQKSEKRIIIAWKHAVKRKKKPTKHGKECSKKKKVVFRNH